MLKSLLETVPASERLAMRPRNWMAALKVRAKPSFLHSWEPPDAWKLLLEMLLRKSSPFASEHGAGLGSEPLIPTVRSGTLHTRCSNKPDLVQG